MPNKTVNTPRDVLTALLQSADPIIVVAAPLGRGVTTFIKEEHPDHVLDITGYAETVSWDANLHLTDYVAKHAPCVFLVDVDDLNDLGVKRALKFASDECQIVLRTGPDVPATLVDYPRITLAT